MQAGLSPPVAGASLTITPGSLLIVATSPLASQAAEARASAAIAANLPTVAALQSAITSAGVISVTVTSAASPAVAVVSPPATSPTASPTSRISNLTVSLLDATPAIDDLGNMSSSALAMALPGGGRMQLSWVFALVALALVLLAASLFFPRVSKRLTRQRMERDTRTRRPAGLSLRAGDIHNRQPAKTPDTTERASPLWRHQPTKKSVSFSQDTDKNSAEVPLDDVEVWEVEVVKEGNDDLVDDTPGIILVTPMQVGVV
jgi:hypothetical protein